jgi:hypothetical protein
MNHAARRAIYKKIEKERDTRVIALVTGERLGWETILAHDAIAPFVSVLDEMGPVPKLSLVLHTNGGHTTAAWRLINLIRSFGDEVEVIVPDKAMSAGTLMALGANRIVMTKQAALGPIDPSLSGHPLAPPTQSATGQLQRVSVSAEAVRGYIDEVKKDIKDPAALASVWTHLAGQIHPIVLGEIFRLGGQIRFLAGELIQNQVTDAKARAKIIQHLCSDSGSHDYTINRREAEHLGLAIEKPSADLYRLLSRLAKSYTEELKTLVPYSPQAVLGGQASAAYTHVRGLIESTKACYGFVSEGQLTVTPANPPAPAGVTDQRSFEGWRKLP